MKPKPQRIALVGGRTAGPIVPLLALADYIKQNHGAEFVVMDVAGSVGQHMAKQQGYKFVRLAAGKWRRYFSWRTFAAPFLTIIGFFQALYYLRREKVNYVIGGGGFVQFPVVWAAWLLRIPRHIHQQDVTVTLTNQLCAPIATNISVTFEPSLRDFSQGSGLFTHDAKSKIHWTGNPCRNLNASKQEAQNFFQLDKSWPTLYVVGGGTGAAGINKLIDEALPELARTVQIIHSTGKGRHKATQHERYHAFEFIQRADLALASADIILTRAGIGTITELSYLGKVSIIIPMPDTHQEANAQLLYEKHAAIVLDQGDVSPDLLVRVIRKLLFDLPMQQSLQDNIKKIMPHDAAAKISQLILKE